MWREALRKMKEQSNLNAEEISAGSGIPVPTLEKIFAGVTKDPKLTTIKNLVHFLGYTLDDLFQDESIKKAPPEIGEDESNLLDLFSQLNEEGQEKVIGYAKDLVQTGAYIKSYTLSVGEK